MTNKAVIFDLNGVFLQAPPLSIRVEKDFGVPTKEFLPVLSEIMDIVRLPNAPAMYPLWEPRLKKWGINFSEKEFYHYWFGAEKEDHKMTSFARKLKSERWKVFVISNNFKERTEYYDVHFPFLKNTIDHVFYTWQTGLLKPDPKCWQTILEKYHLEPKNCFYFDDSEKNVEAAKSLGIHSYKFESMEQVERLVR